VTLVCQSWFPGVWGGGGTKKKEVFLVPPQRGLEGKKKKLGVSRGLEEEERKGKRDIYTESLVAIY